ncbi:DUF4123 domain-containing protein [Luteimonas yindakuii]|nr:DUF4123 domain-containing protein [Luteimonas yindakuii]
MQGIDVIVEHIGAYADEEPARMLYAIVDLARLDAPLDRLAQLKRTPGACNLFAGQPEASAETLAPWLWPITAEQRGPRLATSLSLERTTAATVSWIATTLPAHEIAHRLTQRMTASLDGKNALFRFYDPRLLPVIAAHLSEAERATFFGLGNGRWFLIGERDDLAHIALHDAEEVFHPPIRISNHLSSALQDASERIQILELLSRSWPEEWADWPAHRRRAYSHALLQESQEREIDSFHRKAWYCRGKLARKALPSAEHWRT